MTKLSMLALLIAATLAGCSLLPKKAATTCPAPAPVTATLEK